MVIAQLAERQLPYDLSAETAVIGSMLIDPQAIFKVADIIRPEDFYRARNNYCFTACLRLVTEQEAVDPITVAKELRRMEMLEAVGGIGYLGELITNTPTSVNVEYYATIVAEAASKRRIFDAGARISEIALDPEKNYHALMQDVMQILTEAQSQLAPSGLRHISEQYDVILQNDLYENGTEPASSVPTGYASLDEVLDNMDRSDLLIIGARPGIGKTSLAINIAVKAAQNGATVAIFSLEMTSHQIAMRLLAGHSGTEYYRLRHGLYTDDEQSNLINSVGMLSELPIYLDDERNQNIQQIKIKLQKLRMERGVDLVIVDYIQLVSSVTNNPKYENRTADMAAISRGLKVMAQDMDVPILACSQLNREIEHRANHQPQLADLRESGTIEQDADVVMLMYREDRNTNPEEWERQYPGHPYPKNVIEINVAKNRNGRTGKVQLVFHETTTRFYDISNQPALDAAA